LSAAPTDLLVVGGGPAGLATAIQARLAGLSVRVLDRARPPIDKACGEGLMPDAAARLSELGIELAPDQCHRFRGIRYVDGDVVAEGLFPRAGGLGVRRLHLHAALERRAAGLGVELWWGTAAAGLAPAAAAAGGNRTVAGGLGAGPLTAGVLTAAGDLVPARWVVGADGLHSRVRRWAGLEGAAARHRRFGVRRHFACRPWSDLVEVHWGAGCNEAYVTPVGPHEVGVAILWSDGKASFDRLLEHFPTLAERLAGAPPLSRDRGAGPLRQRARAVWCGNVALVGDAAGYLDAITGEGLAVALHQSAALVAALAGPAAAGERPGAPSGAAAAARRHDGRSPRERSFPGAHLAAYGAAHRRICRLPDFMTSLVLALERRPRLRRRALRALAADPALFSRLLGIHARSLSPADLGIDGALRLVYRLVTA
jgi:flavin-dependent dehydrogenase